MDASAPSETALEKFQKEESFGIPQRGLSMDCKYAWLQK